MKVGLFGLLGAGNMGNDGSLEVVLAYLRTSHPSAELSAMCSGSDVVEARYGIPAAPLYWYYTRDREPGLLVRVGLKSFGKVRDAARLLRWVRRQDVVIVPGAGVLENTLPLRAWGFPLSMFLLSLFGRLTGTKVAFVNVGANIIRQRVMRTFYRWATRLAHYRSFRDSLSRDAVGAMGVDTSRDEIYPDLVFALPNPDVAPEPGTVAVGIMDFHGSNDDRARAEQIHRTYVDGMRAFVRGLVESGHRVRLLIGDEVDETVVARVLAEHPSGAVTYEPIRTLGDVMAQIARAEVVVGTRYHNVLCALKLAKPTISVSYSAKNDRIMADMGLREYTQDARTVDVDRLTAQFTAVAAAEDRVRPLLEEHVAHKTAALARQFEVLSACLGMPAEVTREVVS
ncbi:polysaccharide pyruvyl transferase family protein [Actinophytocola glycyrrhizae]|uniref:Polysaccharide pyruvyl transferase family protein n=1 Tax=Actinophytocola glycyrrhizae TaxID=2044873 RepID=A0ABV9SDA7_9PSEU